MMKTNMGQPIRKDREAYKGYYLIKSLSAETWYISKDGTHVGSAASLEEAHQIVNLLVGG